MGAHVKNRCYSFLSIMYKLNQVSSHCARQDLNHRCYEERRTWPCAPADGLEPNCGPFDIEAPPAELRHRAALASHRVPAVVGSGPRRKPEKHATQVSQDLWELF